MFNTFDVHICSTPTISAPVVNKAFFMYILYALKSTDLAIATAELSERADGLHQKFHTTFLQLLERPTPDPQVITVLLTKYPFDDNFSRFHKCFEQGMGTGDSNRAVISLKLMLLYAVCNLAAHSSKISDIVHLHIHY